MTRSMTRKYNSLKPYEPIDQKEYNTEYYRRNREKILAKIKLAKANSIANEVLKWKETKLNSPHCFCPFYE